MAGDSKARSSALRPPKPAQNQIHAHLERVTESPRWMRLQFAGGIAVEMPHAEYERVRENKEWMVEFPKDALRVV